MGAVPQGRVIRFANRSAAGQLLAKKLAESLAKQAGNPDSISNLKLQKLLYYAQGFHLAMTGEPLFRESIEAWNHGPVVPDCYHAFKAYGAGPIPPPTDFDPGCIPPEVAELLDEVYAVYGQFSAWRLRDMTHEEAPLAERGRIWWRDQPRGDAGILRNAAGRWVREDSRGPLQ